MQVRYGLLLRHTGVQSFDTLAEFEIVLCRPEVVGAVWGGVLLGEGLIAVPPAPTSSFADLFVRKLEASPIKGAGDHADSDRRFSEEAQTNLCGRRVAQHHIAQAQRRKPLLHGRNHGGKMAARSESEFAALNGFEKMVASYGGVFSGACGSQQRMRPGTS